MSNPAASAESLSLWIDTTTSTHYPSLWGEVTADVAIVGGGITGITAAYLLAKAGRSVVLVDKGRIAMSETGHTAAHIVDTTDADYQDLIKNHGEENARLTTESLRASIALIRSVVDELHIDCGLKAVDGYFYTEDKAHRQYLQREQEFLRQAGIETEWVEEVPLPFPTHGGLRYRNQYIFHIRRYLLAVADACAKHGTRIFENSLASELRNAEQDGFCVVKTEEGSIRASHVLLATHVPINDRKTIWTKMYQKRTYVVAAPINRDNIPDALFWDTALPYHNTRLLDTSSGRYLIVGGEDRDVGKDSNDESRYKALEGYCRSRFGVTDFTHRWSGQIIETDDALPFIGESSHGKNVWMSTGYSGTGITYGTLSAMLFSDYVLERDNRFAKLYEPTRRKVGTIFEDLVTKTRKFRKRIEKVRHLDVEGKSVDQIEEGEGKIVSTDGTTCAAARIDGELRLLDPTCPHMACTVAWNSAEKSWDCPCHGSRFDTRGRVLNGPATSPLAPNRERTK